MTKILIVGCGGFMGAVARYGMTLWISERWPAPLPGGGAGPWGTMAVNVLGCFLLGYLMAWVAERPGLSPELVLFLRVGLLGAFTTFSTLGYETLELFEHSEWRAGALSLLGNVVLGLGAAFTGALLARWWYES